MRKEFEMSPEDLAEIIARIDAARNTPLVAIHCGLPQSVQEAANDAWADLGKRLGFDPMSVQRGRSDRHFTAEATL